MTDLVPMLRAALGDRYVLTEAAATAEYLQDWRGRYKGTALCVVRPGTTDEVAQAVRICNAANAAIVPQGGNTGLCGGATPRGGEVVFSLTRLSHVRSVGADNNTITVEAGCTLQTVQQVAEAAGRLFPLSIASEGTATIGGCLSTNAGGVHVLRYGNARELVLGIEAVLPDGRVWNGLRGLRKDNTGYDLKQLFIGAEGTLGLITAAVLKLFPRPHARATAWVAVESAADAVLLLASLRADLGDRVTAFELIGREALCLVMRHISGARAPLPGNHDWQVLVEVSAFSSNDGLDERLQGSLAKTSVIRDAALAQNETQRLEFWRLRERISEAQRIDGLSIKHDISVPVSRIAEFIYLTDAAVAKAFPGVRVVCFGHVGDGNLHYNLSRSSGADNDVFIARSEEANRIVHDLVDCLGGSISAEHGLGQLKRDEIRRYKSAIEIELMQSIKHALDPRGLMNPGKVI